MRNASRPKTFLTRLVAVAATVWAFVFAAGWYFSELTATRSLPVYVCIDKLRRIASAHAEWLQGASPPVQWLLDNGRLPRRCPLTASPYVYMGGRQWRGHQVIVACRAHGIWRRDLLLRWQHYPFVLLVDTRGQLRAVPLRPVPGRRSVWLRPLLRRQVPFPLKTSGQVLAGGYQPDSGDVIHESCRGRSIRRAALLSIAPAVPRRTLPLLPVINTVYQSPADTSRFSGQSPKYGWGAAVTRGTPVLLASRGPYLYLATHYPACKVAKLHAPSGLLLWSTTLPGIDARLSAIAVGDRWVTVIAGKLYILDDRTGKQLHCLRVQGACPEPSLSSTAGHGTSRSALHAWASSNVLCLFVGAGRGASISVIEPIDGRVLWRRRFDAAAAREIIVHDSSVHIVSQGGQLHTFDLMSGRMKWKVQLGAVPIGRPVRLSRMLAIPTAKGLHVVDCSTRRQLRYEKRVARLIPLGRQSLVAVSERSIARLVIVDRQSIVTKWQRDMPGCVRQAVASARRIYVRSDRELIAVDSEAGHTVWQLPISEGSVTDMHPLPGGVVVRWGSYLFVLADTFSPHVWHWIAPGPISRHAETRRRVFLTHAKDADWQSDRILTAIDADTGRPLWTRPLGANSQRTEQLAATPKVVVASFGRRLLGFSTRSGTPTWTLVLESPCNALAADRDLVYVSARYRGISGVHAFDATTAEHLWSAPWETRLPIALRKRMLAVTTVEQELVVLERTTGRVLARRSGARSQPEATAEGFVAWANMSTTVRYLDESRSTIRMPLTPPTGSLLAPPWTPSRAPRRTIIRTSPVGGVAVLSSPEPLAVNRLLLYGSGQLVLVDRRVYAFYAYGFAHIGTADAGLRLGQLGVGPDGLVFFVSVSIQEPTCSP